MIALIESCRAEAEGETNLTLLCDAVARSTAWMFHADTEDRLAGSYPFLEIVSVMTVGALMARQGRAADAATPFGKAKIAVVRYYLDHIVPEALGKIGSATAGADGLYALSAEELAAA